MSNLIPLNDIEKMAKAITASKLFGVKDVDQAIALMLIAQAEGMHPALAARDYHVIQGRPSLKADSMMARFQSAGGKVEWSEYTNESVIGTFSHPAGGSVTIQWTMKMARDIGLAGKDNWKNYPRAMLRSRCISEGIRTVYPGCIANTYSDEETEDFKPIKVESATVKDMGAADVVVEEIKESVKVLDKPVGDGFFPLLTPHPDNLEEVAEEPYSVSTDLESWEISFHDLVGRIKASNKMDTEMKRAKLKRLKEVNDETIKKLDAATRMRVIAASNSMENI